MASLRLVFVEPENATNVGMLARVMKNFGFYDLSLVRPMFSSFERAHSAAMHARDVLTAAMVSATINEATEGVDLIIGTTARAATRSSMSSRAVELRDFVEGLRWDANYAILIGRESTGLTRGELDLCHVVLTIRANPEYPTMNAVTAAAIVLYEFYGKIHETESPLIEPVKTATRKQMLKYLDDILSSLTLPDHKRRRAYSLLDRVIGRTFPCGLAESEATYLLGVLRLTRNGLAGDEVA